MFGLDQLLQSPVLLLLFVFIVIAFTTGLVLLVIIAWRWGVARMERILAVRAYQRYCRYCGCPLTRDLFCRRCFRYLDMEAGSSLLP